MAIRSTSPASGRNRKAQAGSRAEISMRAGAREPGGGISTRSRAANRVRANTRRMGWANEPAEYCVTGSALGKPQSHGGARRTAPVARRWMTKADSSAEEAMKRKTRRPL